MAPPTHGMPRHYLLNAPVLTGYGRWSYLGPLGIEEARAFVRGAPFRSAIGHATTAAHLTDLLGVPVHTARMAAALQPGDRALVFRLGRRLAEGQILDRQALQATPAEFGLLERQE